MAAASGSARPAGAMTQSLYVPARDGTMLAIDVNLPKDLPEDERVPTVLISARYWRSFQLRTGDRPNRPPMGPRAAIEGYLVAHGYAVVTVDVRGSGASYGAWRTLFSDTEVAGVGDVGRWVTEQPWSDGTLGAVGISYEGTTAEMLAASGVEGVRAVIPQEMEFDVYPDIIAPGGVMNEAFVREWDHTNRLLDAGNVPKAWGFSARLFVKGPRPADDDRSGEKLRAAVAEHAGNLETYAAATAVTFRDDPFGDDGGTLDDASAFSRKEAIEASGAAVFGWGSWLDGSTADTVIRRFMTFDNAGTAAIGAWSHNMQTHGSPYAKPKSDPDPLLERQWQKCVRFFDHHMRGVEDPALDEPRLSYYTLAEERWKETDVWPVEGTVMRRWYLREDGALSEEAPAGDGSDRYEVDFDATTGTANRWHTQDGMTAVAYPDRAAADERLLTYTSPPLAADIEITGYPTVQLWAASTHEDGAFFAYLEDVDESGRVTYVTEGVLRAIHRKQTAARPPYPLLVPYHTYRRADAMPLVPGEVAEVAFGLQPTSVLVRQGHRIRVALAGADADSFARIPEEGTPTITVERSGARPSCVWLPVIERD
jgi:putative CocE/NonD family hydrolase